MGKTVPFEWCLGEMGEWSPRRGNSGADEQALLLLKVLQRLLGPERVKNGPLGTQRTK